ncbi:MAG: DUF3536 domain-containing protein [Cyanobacteria bacterium J06641_5]
MNDQATPGIFVAIHGHFYQPPRENPYLEAIERQPSAHPSHDWNERIYRECYRPNAWARILDTTGKVVGIVNNFEYLSFNAGPTLLSWLERYDPEIYQRILVADRRSCERLNGHGNAIAQAYNHAILPLANARDRRTQILWGIADFQARFGRDPEGMWLPETAVDYPTLTELAAAGIRFVILAPSQASRCRPLSKNCEHDSPWCDVGDRIDSTQPYRCWLPPGAAAEYIDLFFYDGESAREIAFGGLLNSAEHLSTQLARAIDPKCTRDQLLAVATDGETFGHHKPGGERCLAYAFTQEFPARGWQITNFAHYLSLHPPTWEVEIVPETAWSCAHGLGRWQTNCGCGTSADGGTWRQPLRASLDWLRDRLATLYECESTPLLQDPWQARDAYGPVMGDRTRAAAFLQAQQRHFLSETESTRVLCLLEMQRQALLMYTSCGWFFEELSRPEGVQVLRYAARALDLAREVSGENLESAFLRRLAAAPSNLPEFENGAEIYRQLVTTARVTPAEVAIHCAIATLLGPTPQHIQTYCYDVVRLDFQDIRRHDLVLAVGHFQLASIVTWERHEFAIAILHVDDWEFHVSVLPWQDCPDYANLKAELFARFNNGKADAIAAITARFGPQVWTLESLFSEERERILQQLGRATRVCLERSYERTYRENHKLLVAFRENGMPVPPALQSAATVVLSQQCASGLQALESAQDNPDARLAALAPVATAIAEAQQLHCQLQLSPEGAASLQRLLWNSLEQLLQAKAIDAVAQRYTISLIELAKHLQAQLSLERTQELYCHWLQEHAPCLSAWEAATLEPLFEIGPLLGVANEAWLARLPQPAASPGK